MLENDVLAFLKEYHVASAMKSQATSWNVLCILRVKPLENFKKLETAYKLYIKIYNDLIKAPDLPGLLFCVILGGDIMKKSNNNGYEEYIYDCTKTLGIENVNNSVSYNEETLLFTIDFTSI